MPDYRAALGRGGDSMMAHMTPGEAVIPAGSMTPKLWAAYQEALDRQGMAPEQYVVGSGQNSINPQTGQPEFAGSVGNVHTTSPAHRDRERDMTQGPEGGSSERPISVVGPVHASPATASLQAAGQLYQGPEGADRNLGATTGPREQGGFVDPNNLPDLTYDQGSGLFNQTSTADLGPLTALLPTPISVGLEMMGFDPTLEYSEPFGQTGTGTSYPERRTSLGAESRQEQGISQRRTQQQQSFMRPEVLPTPQFLGLSSAMSPLQMRSAIASRAVAGQGGEYTSPEAQSYYDNLLQQVLIGEDGTLAGLDTLLPIDLQYLAQVRGIENPADTSALLTALLG